MNAATSANDLVPEVCQPEWRILTAHSHNVLLEGPIVDTHAALLRLQPHIRKPIAWGQPQGPLELPAKAAGALVLWDVEKLSLADQARLLLWIDESDARVQVVSTTEHSLFPLVRDGLFNAELYYRLNVMLLRVGVANLSGLPEDDQIPIQTLRLA
jgi:hypothetical protein